MASKTEKAFAFKEPSPLSHYAKETEWQSIKQLKTGKVTVAECEMHILHLEGEKTRHEKFSLIWQKKAEIFENDLNEIRSSYHKLETNNKLIEKDRENILTELKTTKAFRRIIEIFIGIGCCGLGVIPSLHPILKKGSNSDTAFIADIIIGLVCVGLIFVPSVILQERK